MRNVSKFTYCYGCGVCASACPRNSISIDINSDGFYSPSVDEASCIDCGVCLDVCSFCHEKVMQSSELNIWSAAAWSRNETIRYNSTSGGMSFEIGRYLLQKGYKVVACRYNSETKRAEHYVASTECELQASIGSKYIQSNSYYGFSRIERGQKYLVIGTPCQIDSLRRWICKMKIENDFFFLDFFCHGVPSIFLWDKYCKELEQKIGHFDDIVWRDKKTGWHDSWVMKVSGRYASWFTKGDMFYTMFLGNRCLGRQCYENCKYKYNNSAADIRIGDFWGRRYAKDEKGVNCVMCFTSKGLELLGEMDGRLHIEPSSIEIVCESQMKKCSRKPVSYRFVMSQLKTSSSLADIHAVACRIEMIEKIGSKLRYYAGRLPFKMLEIIGLKNKPEI